MKTLAVYSRISVDRPDQLSIAVQKEMGEQFAKDNGYHPLHFTDTGISGGTAEGRPDYMKMIEKMKAGEIDAVFVYTQDRLQRNEIDYFEFLNVMLEKKIDLFEDGRKVDLDDESMRMLGGFKAVIAASERRKTGKKVKSAIVKAVSMGKVSGVIPYGFTRDEEGYMVVNEEEAKIVRHIFDRYVNHGEGYLHIARWMNEQGIPTRYNTIGGEWVHRNKYTRELHKIQRESVQWTAGTVKSVLANTVHKGVRMYDGVAYECPRLVEDAIWERANDMVMKRKKKAGKKTVHPYLLNEILRCGICGDRKTGRIHDAGGVYRCVNHRKDAKKEYKCKGRDIQMKYIEKIVWERMLLGGALLEAVKSDLKSNDTEKEIVAIRKEIKESRDYIEYLESKKNKAWKIAMEEELPKGMLKSQLAELDAKVTQTERKIISLTDSLKFAKKKLDNEADVMRDINRLKKQMPFENKKRLVQKYIKRIECGWDTELRVYPIIIEYHLPIEKDVYVVDLKYNFALEARTGIGFQLREKVQGTPEKQLAKLGSALFRLKMSQKLFHTHEAEREGLRPSASELGFYE